MTSSDQEPDKTAEEEPKDSDKEQPSGGKTPPLQDNQPLPFRGFLMWLLVFAVIVIVFWMYAQGTQGHKDIDYYPDFVEHVEKGRVDKCEIIRDVTGTMHIEAELDTNQASAEVEIPPRVKVSITEGDNTPEYLQKMKVRYKTTNESPVLREVLTGFVPILILFAIIYFVFIRQIKSAGRGVMSFGRSRAKLLVPDSHKTTFKDVAGIDEAKEEVHEIIAFLKDPKKFQKLGGRIPKGVLLMGQPGTGKTLLAKAIAGEADVPFFSISGSDFVEMYVGVGASRVRDMFEQGKTSAPCIIFIDEIDAVGRSRFTGIGGGHDEREQTLNALLVEMDGFETSEGLIIIAATNRPDVLDPALLRPGRFDRQIVIDLPLVDGREEILKLHAKKITLDEKADLRRLGRGTPGFSGADLENLLNEAALSAAMQSKEAVEMADLEEARDKVRWGRERRSRVLDDKEKEITAYHEAGHALVSCLTEGSEPVHKITIIPRGSAYLGATMQLPEKDTMIESETRIRGMLDMTMGGRAAEQLMWNEMTTGARGDFREATKLARSMVCDWGMSDVIGPQSLGEQEELMFLGREVNRTQVFSEQTAQRIDNEVSRMLRESYDRALKLLTDNRDKLEALAKILLERETLDGMEVDEIAKHGRLLSEEERNKDDDTSEG